MTKSRGNGTNPRAKGTNPRAKGTNPRARGATPQSWLAVHEKPTPKWRPSSLEKLADDLDGRS